MVHGFFLAAGTVPVRVKRQGSDGFGQNPDAGIDRRGLQRRFLVDRFAAGACAEEKAVWTAPEAVFWTGSRRKKSRQEGYFHDSPPENGRKKAPAGADATIYNYTIINPDCWPPKNSIDLFYSIFEGFFFAFVNIIFRLIELTAALNIA